MTRLFPQSLFGQTLLILLVGLVASHGVGSWIYTADRGQAVRAVGGFATAQRIVNLARLIQETPRELRSRVLATLSDEGFRVTLSAQAPPMRASGGDGDVEEAIKGYLSERLSLGPARQPRIWISPIEGLPYGPRHMMMPHSPMMMRGFGAFGALRELQVAIPLADGSWLTFAAGLPVDGPAYSSQFLLSMAIMAIIILAVSAWAVRRITTPLAALATAAERLGQDVSAPPLAEAGTFETKQAARAFNDMQVRLRKLVDNRTRLLAAISHDLRTPLTLLRLRAENVENAQERDKMLSTIAEMDGMISATLEFARDQSADEPRRQTNLATLLSDAVEDMKDAGFPVAMRPAKSVNYTCTPAALKRAIRNLLDNAVKYGNSAMAEIHETPRSVEICIDDQGPGIPEHELSRVLEPFYRLDESRSRETGGVGLGLAITQSIVQAHGGTLMLVNRPEGGLRAKIVLPRAAG